LKVFSDTFAFDTQGEFDFIDLSARVGRIVRKSGISEGIALVFAGHATGVLVVTEYESRLLRDIREFLQNLVPSKGGYHHPGNAAAHLRSVILTPSRVIPIHDGHLALGTWQSIFWVEAETRPRHRKVEVYVMGAE
jgi:secondary thiamine-phosphate synthase enzyme